MICSALKTSIYTFVALALGISQIAGAEPNEVLKHWAYVAPKSSPLPAVTAPAWCENAIDRFILARLEQDQIAPSPRTDRERLIRRASLDLIGLPPSLAE